MSNNASAAATPRVPSPVKFGFSSATPAKAETSEVDVSGERSAWDDVEGGARAHRELSVIDEAASPAKSMVPRPAGSEYGDDDDRDLGGRASEGRKLDVIKKGGTGDLDDRDDRDDDGPSNDDSGGPDHATSPPKV